MKQRLPTIAVCLLLGAVVTVAVAWACAAWIRFGPFEAQQYEREGGGTWSILSWRAFGSRRIVCVRPRAMAGDEVFGEGRLPWPPAWARIEPQRPPPPNASVVVVAAEARGWPLAALAVCFETGSPPPSFHTRVALGGIEIRPADQKDNVYDASARTLPLRPVWGGFAGDTLVFAASAWLLSRLPATWRRRVRLARGLCPNCGYPPGTSAVCTECGSARPARLTKPDPKGAHHGQSLD